MKRQPHLEEDYMPSSRLLPLRWMNWPQFEFHNFSDRCGPITNIHTHAITPHSKIHLNVIVNSKIGNRICVWNRLLFRCCKSRIDNVYSDECGTFGKRGVVSFCPTSQRQELEGNPRQFILCWRHLPPLARLLGFRPTIENVVRNHRWIEWSGLDAAFKEVYRWIKWRGLHAP